MAVKTVTMKVQSDVVTDGVLTVHSSSYHSQSLDAVLSNEEIWARRGRGMGKEPGMRGRRIGKGTHLRLQGKRAGEIQMELEAQGRWESVEGYRFEIKGTDLKSRAQNDAGSTQRCEVQAPGRVRGFKPTRGFAYT